MSLRSQPFETRTILRPQMPELDTIRGAAVLMVFVFHAFGSEVRPERFDGLARTFTAATVIGRTGVNLFFVLSGFLITGILIESRNRPHYWRRFYARRALRILPAYYLLLLVLPLAALIPTMPQKVGWHFLAFSFVYLANLSEMFGVNMEYGPLWSLAVEEHFYIGWPWVVRWLSLRGILAAASCVVVASPIVRALTFSYGGAWNGTVRTWNSLDGLAMGALLAVAVRGPFDQRKLTKYIAAFALAIALVGFLVGRPHGILSENCDFVGKALRTTVENSFYLFVVASVLVIGTGKFANLVNVGWLRFFGFISYGFYLAHVLLLHTYDALVGRPTASLLSLALRATVVFALCTLICWLSRTTFEEWFLSLKNRFDGTMSKSLAPADPQPVPVAASVANAQD